LTKLEEERIVALFLRILRHEEEARRVLSTLNRRENSPADYPAVSEPYSPSASSCIIDRRARLYARNNTPQEHRVCAAVIDREWLSAIGRAESRNRTHSRSAIAHATTRERR